MLQSDKVGVLFHKFQQTYSWQWRISETLPSPNFQSHGSSHWRYSKSQESIWHWLSQICCGFYKSIWRYTNQTFLTYIYYITQKQLNSYVCINICYLSIYIFIYVETEEKRVEIQWRGVIKRDNNIKWQILGSLRETIYPLGEVFNQESCSFTVMRVDC